MTDQLAVGHVFQDRRRFTQEDFDRFAQLSGDDNPIHVDEAFASRTRFGRTVCHGMLLYGAICGLLSAHLGDVVQIAQELMFPAPTYAGDEVTIRAEVTHLEPSEGQVQMTILVTRQDEEVVCQGQTTLRQIEP
jgi:acyl dehydratase